MSGGNENGGSTKDETINWFTRPLFNHSDLNCSVSKGYDVIRSGFYVPGHFIRKAARQILCIVIFFSVFGRI